MKISSNDPRVREGDEVYLKTLSLSPITTRLADLSGNEKDNPVVGLASGLGVSVRNL